MIFKELRPLICSPLKLIIGRLRIVNVSLSDFTNKYDNYEVIGVRSEIDFKEKYAYNNSRVVVSLAEKAVVTDTDLEYNDIREETGRCYVGAKEINCD